MSGDAFLAFFLMGGYCGDIPSGTSTTLFAFSLSDPGAEAEADPEAGPEAGPEAEAAGCRESVYRRRTYFFISLVAAVQPEAPSAPSLSSRSRSLISLSRFSVLDRTSRYGEERREFGVDNECRIPDVADIADVDVSGFWLLLDAVTEEEVVEEEVAALAAAAAPPPPPGDSIDSGRD